MIKKKEIVAYLFLLFLELIILVFFAEPVFQILEYRFYLFHFLFQLALAFFSSIYIQSQRAATAQDFASLNLIPPTIFH